MNTALIPIASERRADPAVPADCRVNADFIAHLIATVARLPQTRARRRAEPEQALAAYRALGQWPTGLGRVLSRSL